MSQTPLRHDRAPARNNSGQPLCRHWNVGEPYTSMNGEVVDTLLSLFDQGVTKNFPREIFRLAINLLQRLINRNGADGNGAVADYPLTGFMNIFASGEIHYRVSSPADGPGHFLDFLLDARTKR